MRLVRVFIVLSAILFLSTNMSWARGTISGVVLDSETKQPVVGVTVSVDDGYLGTISDSLGKFKLINIPEKHFSINFVSYEYKTLVVDSYFVQSFFNKTIDTFYVVREKNGIEIVSSLELLPHFGPGTEVKIGREEVFEQEIIDDINSNQTYSFSGYIFSVEDSLPIHGSTIKILGANKGVMSNSDGYFIVYDLSIGKNNIYIDAFGFESLADLLTINDTSVVDTFYLEKRIKNISTPIRVK